MVDAVDVLAGAADIENLEGEHAFDITWPWTRGRMRPGTTAVLRVKDEARNLPWVLPPLLRVCESLVLVDNGSTDGTPDVARRVATENGAADKLRVHDYPFTVSRCGPEHLHTPAESVRSLVYFYNWAFSHVQTTYSLKWDGDMVLTEDGEKLLGDLAWQLPGQNAVLRLHRHSLYVESDRVAYLDLGLRNIEPYGYPMHPSYPHVKAFEWEMRAHSDDLVPVTMPEGTCLELKHLDSDEFAHWTAPESFAESARTERKRREWELFAALQEGRWADREGIHRIEAPEGTHVIDYVTHTWLPRRERPLTPPPGAGPPIPPTTQQ